MAAKLFAPAAEPPTPLGRHRILSPTAGVRVSPLCLGGMNFGDAWADIMGKCDKNMTFNILDHFYEAGGNFIDTANNYQNEESEKWIGEWMTKRGVRDEMVIATKYTTNIKMNARKNAIEQHSNLSGNSVKSMHISVEGSLKKLQTDYIDVLYVHWYDNATSIEEMMQGLNRLVSQGKVLYLGISDTPAWIVAKANQYAKDHGLKQFSIYQGMWNCARRDLEEEVLPMCLADGMAVAPWKSIGGGLFKTAEQRKNTEGRNMGGPLDVDVKMSETLEKIAKRKNTILTSVALAYVLHTVPDCYPIVGGRNVDHLKANIDALKLELTKEDMDEIRNASGFQPRFPTNFLYVDPVYDPNARTPNKVGLNNSVVHIDVPQARQPVHPGAASTSGGELKF